MNVTSMLKLGLVCLAMIQVRPSDQLPIVIHGHRTNSSAIKIDGKVYLPIEEAMMLMEAKFTEKSLGDETVLEYLPKDMTAYSSLTNEEIQMLYAKLNAWSKRAYLTLNVCEDALKPHTDERSNTVRNAVILGQKYAERLEETTAAQRLVRTDRVYPVFVVNQDIFRLANLLGGFIHMNTTYALENEKFPISIEMLRTMFELQKEGDLLGLEHHEHTASVLKSASENVGFVAGRSPR